MNPLALKIFRVLPPFLKRFFLRVFESYYVYRTRKIIKADTANTHRKIIQQRNKKPRILFYHIAGLSFGGTEKFLQILAKHLDYRKYDIYFMYSSKSRLGSDDVDGRLSYLRGANIKLIAFDYDWADTHYPYIVRGMKPSIFDVIRQHTIDVLVTAGGGYSEFPFNIIQNIPIILLNIFGAPSLQKNIFYHVCISHAVARKALAVVQKQKIKVMYIASEGPPHESKRWGRQLREKLGISRGNIVFGRIGRPSDDIFDPIGIRAFQRVVKEKPWIHYLIMAPPPLLRSIVSDEGIPNVHFLNPSSRENDVWVFHQAIDVMAHFRKDGESFGLNIAEAMLCGKPILTHKSPIWNAQFEYLTEGHSRVAEIGNIEEYARHLKFFADDKNRKRIKHMGEHARKVAEPLFLIKNTINTFDGLIQKSLSVFHGT